MFSKKKLASSSDVQLTRLRIYRCKQTSSIAVEVSKGARMTLNVVVRDGSHSSSNDSSLIFLHPCRPLHCIIERHQVVWPSNLIEHG